jgi:hypothetical protein
MRDQRGKARHVIGLLVALLGQVAHAAEPSCPAEPRLLDFVDLFTHYDYQAGGKGFDPATGRMSTLLVLHYPDGVTLDLDFNEVSENDPDLKMLSEHLHKWRWGPGCRVFPAELNRRTTPRLYAAKRAALAVIEKLNLELIELADAALAVTLPLPAGGLHPAAEVLPPRRARAPLPEKVNPPGVAEMARGSEAEAGAVPRHAEAAGEEARAAVPAPGEQAPEPTQRASERAVLAPEGRTLPSRPPDPQAKPRGKKTAILPQEDSGKQRSLRRENQAAEILARAGYDVEQNPTVEGTTREPDYRIEGRIFDCYAPTSDKPRNIWTQIDSEKVNPTRTVRQTDRIVLHLDDSNVDLGALRKQFQDWPMPGLKEVIVIRHGQVIHLWP